MRKAFTLIELLTVIAILGVVIAIATVALQSAQAKARDGKRVQDVREIQKSLELYFNERAGYPGDGDAGGGYIVLGEGATSLSGGNGWNSPASGTTYMARVTKDPSPSQQYRYRGRNTQGDAECASVSMSVAGCGGYWIDFTLEKGVTGLPGLNCRGTPSGLTCN